jgi:hypothetical protein
MTNQPETVQSEQPSASLGLSDLALMANIIQVTSERGAIKANEMAAVGTLYTKLVTFVNANVPQQPEADSEDVATPEDEGEEQ